MSAVIAGENDVTLDARSPLAIQARPEVPENSGTPIEMELFEGDTGSSKQSDTLVQTRLKAAAFAIGFGFAVFCIWTLVRELMADPDSRTTGWFIGFLLETFAGITLIGVGVWLASTKLATKFCLLSSEFIIFALPSLVFGVLHFQELFFIAENVAFIPSIPMSSWVILVLSYAIFVPYDWRRVLIVVLAISAIPILATVACMMYHPDVLANIKHYPASAIEMLLVLVITDFVAVSSVQIISQLRHRADTAKELGRYRLKEKIGSGGMGDVYLAEHRLMKRPCAIKVIHPEKAYDPRAIARFEREVRATAKLSHWNSVSIYDYGRTADGKFFYVMEYLTGLSLQEMVKRRGPLSPGRCIFLLKQVCNALAEAHDMQLVHRDIKPANLMVTELGRSFDVIKLLDFGLAKPIANEMANTEDSELTIAGALTGSPLYMSPEQAMGDKPSDHRTDIYAVGGVAFYMLTGRPPFEVGPTLKVLLSHLHEPAVAPSTVRDLTNGAKISREFDEIVLRCLAKSPDDRFQSARDLYDALCRLPESNQWNDRMAENWWTSNCSHYQSQHG